MSPGPTTASQVGIVGVGFGIGQNHFTGIQDKAAENNVVVAAGCDVYSRRRAWMRGEVAIPYANEGKPLANPLKDADVYEDYRKLLERKDIDAVLIATHDPWHAADYDGCAGRGQARLLREAADALSGRGLQGL